MSEALIGLFGVVLGAVVASLIARATQRRALRVEVDRYWATRLHEAASELVESYTLARSTLAQAREARTMEAPTDNALAYDLRRSAQGRLFTLPDGRQLQDEADQLRRTLDAVRATYGSAPEEWNQALYGQELAVHDFQERVAAILTARAEV